MQTGIRAKSRIPPLHNTVDNLPDFVDNPFWLVDNPPINYKQLHPNLSQPQRQ